MILDIDPRFVPMNLPYNQEHWNMISTILMLKESYTPGKLALCYNTFLNRFFNRYIEWNWTLYKKMNNHNGQDLSKLSEIEGIIHFLSYLDRDETIKDTIKDGKIFTPALRECIGLWLTPGLAKRLKIRFRINNKVIDLKRLATSGNNKQLIVERGSQVICSLSTFYIQHPTFNSKQYRLYNNLHQTTEVDAIVHWSTNNKNNEYLNKTYDYKFNKIILYPHNNFDNSNGGIVALYNFCRLLDEYGECVRISKVNHWNQNKLQRNNFYNAFHNVSSPINKNDTLVIYCEGTGGNPLNSQYVVRWMLSELGRNIGMHAKDNWGKKEIVYFFNKEDRFYKEPHKMGSIYKDLSLLTINPILWNNFNPQNIGRDRFCHAYRKADRFHEANTLKVLHPKNSTLIPGFEDIQLMHLIQIFSTHKCFVCYDPLTFLAVISALLGCVALVHPVKNKNRLEWYKTLAPYDYLMEHKEPLYGIAYGMAELDEAKRTLPLVKEQWKRILKYYYDKHLNNFITDMNKIETLENTLDKVW
jgi:hypothetical protein